MGSSRKKSRGRAGKATNNSGAPLAAPESPAFSYAQAAAGATPAPAPIAEDAFDRIPAGDFEEALEDVHTRFILNLPDEEFETADRIFFQLEQAYWFYDDILCDAGDDPDQPDMPKLQRFKNLRPFARKMFEFSPLLEHMLPQFDTMYNQFREYKHKISTYGTILMNKDCTRIVLCQAYFGNSWTFPAGKVNQNETGIEAGARETYEETGFDPNCHMGETKRMKEETDAQGGKLPWSALRPEDALTYVEEGTKKRRTCYVCRGVPEDFDFAPVSRKEVKDIQWYDIYDVPKKSYAVIPFVKQLRRWIRKNAKDSLAADGGGKRSKSKKKGGRDASTKKGRDNSTKKGRASSRNGSRGKVRDESDNLVSSGLASPGDERGWTAEEMFEANEKITGNKIDYDGNPHVFAEKGFDGKDPHAFHVVGGGFMNSGEGIECLAPAPDKSRLQPLFREGDDTDNNADTLKPFFSEDGATPWGEVMPDPDEAAPTAASASSSGESKSKKKNKKNKKDKGKGSETPQAVPSAEAGKNLLNMLQGKSGPNEDVVDKQPSTPNAAGLDVFMTDREITSRSQAEKRAGKNAEGEDGHIIYMRQWVKNLPQVEPTEMFGDFRLDKEAILKALRC